MIAPAGMSGQRILVLATRTSAAKRYCGVLSRKRWEHRALAAQHTTVFYPAEDVTTYEDAPRMTSKYRNLAEAQRLQAERLGPGIALRFKRHGLYHDITWDRYRADSVACAAALINAGIRPGDRVGLLAENSAEWLIADMGILTAAAINVPPHAPLTGKQVAYQLADAGACWLFVSNRDQLEKVLAVLEELPELRGVVVFEGKHSKQMVPIEADPSGLVALPRRDGKQVTVLPWSGFLQRGRTATHPAEIARREAGLGSDDLATIMYTSGTTGNPKGVMLTHGNLLSNACAISQVSPHQPDDVVLSVLPYSHIYARTVDHYRQIIEGMTIALAESLDTLVQNLADVHPTHMACVPRFYEKILSAVASPAPADVTRRLRRIYGPRMDWLMSGGAALPPAIARAYFDAGLRLLQGYGLTESSPVITCNHRDEYKLETVGLALPGVEVKIAPDGEILARGPNVMKGYWNNPQATAEALDADGWLHTGDLGSLDADGFLAITGRKKELMVLSTGKKIVPNYLEGLLAADDCIDQAVIYGEGRNFLTALIVPHGENVRRALQATCKPVPASDDELANNPAVYELLEQRIQKALADVSRTEQVRKFLVLPQPFTVASDELTVSLKLRRNVIFERYRDRLEALYSKDAASVEE
jgi:long-chain acyl-CoA synthetase